MAIEAPLSVEVFAFTYVDDFLSTILVSQVYSTPSSTSSVAIYILNEFSNVIS